MTLRLECFKQSTDKIPLDSIDIQKSALTINCQDELPNIYETPNNSLAIQSSSCNSFRVICGDKQWILLADSPQTCIKWLQNLQKLRKRLNDKNDDLNDFDTLNELNDSECVINSSGELRTSEYNSLLQSQRLESEFISL